MCACCIVKWRTSDFLDIRLSISMMKYDVAIVPMCSSWSPVTLNHRYSLSEDYLDLFRSSHLCTSSRSQPNSKIG
jgi:hypothetical protein